MSEPSHRLVDNVGRASSQFSLTPEISRPRSAPSDTTIRNGLLGVAAIFAATLVAGEWGFAAAVVVIAILVGYYDSGKLKRKLDSTVRRCRE